MAKIDFTGLDNGCLCVLLDLLSDWYRHEIYLLILLLVYIFTVTYRLPFIT